MKTIILILALATGAIAAEAPPQETMKELELRRALIQSQMQVLTMQFQQLKQEADKLEQEWERRKPKEVKPTK